MPKEITVLRVEKNKGGHKVWRIKKCTTDPAYVGTATASGTPYPADCCPLGSEYRTVFTIPKKRKSK